MSKVYLEKCESYDYKKIEEIVFNGMKAMDKLEARITPGCRVLVKPNLLKGNKPEDGVTTHPFVVEAAVKYLMGKGCKVVIADSPGGPFNEMNLKGIYRVSGLKEVAERTGCELNNDFESEMVENFGAKRLLRMDVIKVATEVDFIVNVAKLKTHCMMTYTGAVKNLFGLIPGMRKADYHLKMKSSENFAEHLVDICEYGKPVISIIDGIIGMEGNGPSAGELRESGVLIIADNPYSADVCACKIIGFDEALVPTICVAKERKLTGSRDDEIEYLCKNPSDINIKPFKLPDTASVTFIGGKVPKFVERFILDSARPKPVVDKGTCIKCGICAEVCPAKVIDMSNGLPEIDLDSCIRCFCCHELCPKKAMKIKRNIIYDRFMGVKR